MARITIYELGQHPNASEHENTVTISLPLSKPRTRPTPGEPPATSDEATPGERNGTDGRTEPRDVGPEL